MIVQKMLFDSVFCKTNTHTYTYSSTRKFNYTIVLYFTIQKNTFADIHDA